MHALDYNLIANSYRIAPDVIGSGYYGKILLASHVCNPELKVAIKTLNKKDMLPGDIKQVKNEIQLLSRLDHPNICKYHETYESPNFMYIVMEYCQGTDLFSRLINKELPRLTEKECKEIFKQILLAVNHCHHNNIVHRDLKPENVMLSYDAEDQELGLSNGVEVKIIDFGLGRVFKQEESKELTAMVGTSYYVAPEVLEGKYSHSCDCWSLGVILYAMLSNHLPFPGANNSEVFKKIKTLPVRFRPTEFASVTEQAKDLILGLLERDTTKRLTCSEALNHLWFKGKGSERSRNDSGRQFLNIGSTLSGGMPGGTTISGTLHHKTGSTALNEGIVKKLKSYQKRSCLRQEALSVLVKLVDSQGDTLSIENTPEKKITQSNFNTPLKTSRPSQNSFFSPKSQIQELREVFSELD